MALWVQKFGGTSLSDIKAIEHAVDLVLDARQQGHQVVVVLSAMGKTTDELIELAHQVDDSPCAQAYDFLISTGEQLAVALFAMIATKKGHKAQPYTGWQAGILTDEYHKKALIKAIHTEPIQHNLKHDIMPVVAGFQGHTSTGAITTLGRSGSDITAVALSVALGAQACHIYTDVEGIYTADPRVVCEARLLHHMTFEEILELSSLGAQVLHTRAVQFAYQHRMPIRVLSSQQTAYSEHSGTLISDEEIIMEQTVVSGVSIDRDQAKLSVLGIPDKLGVVSEVIEAVSNANVEMDMIVQNTCPTQKTIDISFTVHREDYTQALALLQNISQRVRAQQVFGDDKVAKLSVVGIGMKSQAQVASSMLATLEQQGIAIQLISTSEIKISVLVHEQYIELGARILHQCFALAQP